MIVVFCQLLYSQDQTQEVSDTLRIKSDKTEYEIIIIENGFNEHEQFISMISVKLPYIEQLNYNACIKIDDENFRATNPGVWVYYAQELKDRKKFTSWEDYGKDQPIILDSEH